MSEVNEQVKAAACSKNKLVATTTTSLSLLAGSTGFEYYEIRNGKIVRISGGNPHPVNKPVK